MTIDTGKREIDRKLHRVVQDADAEQYPTAMALGQYIADKELAEFSYERSDGTRYSGRHTIAEYVQFARELGLLDDALNVARPKADVRSLENFQAWLGNVAVKHLSSNGASLDQIKAAVDAILSNKPRSLPTLQNVHKELKPTLGEQRFRLSLRVVSLLRPKAISLITRRVVAYPGILVG